MNKYEEATTKDTKEKKNYFYNLFCECMKEEENEKVMNSNLVYCIYNIYMYTTVPLELHPYRIAPTRGHTFF